MIWQGLASLARLLPAEAAHRAAVTALRYNIGPHPAAVADSVDMGVTFAGLSFANPLGLAAGFDKNAACFNGAMRLGFGHVEVGTITPRPQSGNPKPRVFRLAADRAVINRYGFNSAGMDVAARHLTENAPVRSGILGVNVGANKNSSSLIDDYHQAVATLAKHADYITLNISSPNTPGLRNLQTKQNLADLLVAGREGLATAGIKDRDVPLFLKIAPDLHDGDLGDIVTACVDAGVAGIIATNTTVSRPPNLVGRHAGEAGGLSGAPLFSMATALLADLARQTDGRVGLIGVGGVTTAWQAYAKILVGANLVQLYTALALDGPDLPGRILAGLAHLMQADGVSHFDAVRGQVNDPVAASQHAFRLEETLSARQAKNRTCQGLEREAD